ncbi:hypothetical protein B0684_06240 [Thioalkalivibrio versutus]|nr:hypothetical protein B0684_06240 [Thioalkalivibrio versutus]
MGRGLALEIPALRCATAGMTGVGALAGMTGCGAAAGMTWWGRWPGGYGLGFCRSVLAREAPARVRLWQGHSRASTLLQ